MARIYDRLIYGMAWLAGFLLVATMVMIVADVAIRNPPFTLQSPAWLFTFTEYSLLLIPCLGAPWLVREKGHVFVEIMLMYLSERNRRRATQLVGVACVIICLVLAWYGGEVALRDYAEARQDTRAFDTPRWMIVMWIPIAFFFMAVEFARFLKRGENFLGLTAENNRTLVLGEALAMEWYWAALILFGTSVLLMMLGIPVALAFFATNIVAAILFMGGERGIWQVINNGFGAMTNFALVPIPMFLLMGELFYHTGLGTRFFNAVDKLLGNIPGRLAYVTLIGGTAFAGPAGSSMGACALLGSLMVPDMMKRGYNKYLSMGPIMGVGGLAVIIPPSALTVLLATLGQTDVGDLLIAGVIPGLVLAIMYGILIYAWTKFDPTAAPAYEVEHVPLKEKWRLVLVDVVPMVAVIVGSVWVMIVGWATPTEAAALGALMVMALAALYRVLTWESFKKSVDGALRVTVMSFLIIFGSATFAQVLAFTGASSGLMEYMLTFNLTPIGMLLMMIGILIFLGCFMDQLSMMLLTAPIFFPLAKTLGFDLTWFGIIMLLALEIGYTTPPFGLLLFVMKGVAPPGTTMRDVYLAGAPFIACVFILIAMIIAFPPLATWLPKMSH